jgi:hypothetical protein
MDPLVNEDDDLLVGGWSTIGILGETNKVAIFMPHQHNRLNLRPVVTGKGDTRASNSRADLARTRDRYFC